LSYVLRMKEANPGQIVPGMRSPKMERAEKALTHLGYDMGKTDQVYDIPSDVEQVLTFRAQQKDLKDRPFAVSDNVLEVAKKELNSFDHDAIIRRVSSDNKHSKKMDALVAKEAKEGFELGASGKHVKILQMRLERAGFSPGSRSGVFDEPTKGALMGFQRSEGLPETGKLNSRTWARLASKTLYAEGPATPAQQIGEQSPAVLSSERMLSKSGFNPGKVDGKFTPRTDKAMERFEFRVHRDQNGEINASDYARLKEYSAAPKTDHQLTVTARDWANNVRFNPNNGRYDWNDYCQGWVNRVTDAAGHESLVSWSASAKDAYYNAKSRGILRTDWQNLRGNAVLYWNVRSNGHVAIATDIQGPDGMPMVLSTGSVLWFRTPGAKPISWTEMMNTPYLGMPTAFSTANVR
jgi:peptidoglycan hydrolase-like protein with peptidoglycan-binding domain